MLARLPVCLYRMRLGWLLGRRLMLLTHQGRHSGVPRRVVLEVVGHDEGSDAYYVVAAWGERAQWLLNLKSNPEAAVIVGRRRFRAVAHITAVEDAERVLREYGERHRIAQRALGRILGSTDPHELASVLPVVSLSPERSGTTPAQ